MANAPTSPAPIFLSLRARKRYAWRARWRWLNALAKKGLRPIDACWSDVSINNGKLVVSGVEHTPGGNARREVEQITVTPDLVFHANFEPKNAESVFIRLHEKFSNAWVSWSPRWRRYCEKAYLEDVITAFEQETGLEISRPRTYTSNSTNRDKIDQFVRGLAPERSILLKPTDGRHCKGIEVMRASQWARMRQRLDDAPDNAFVVQELIDRTPLYYGHRFDLRIYAMAWSLKPLRYHLYREAGIVRIAGRMFDPDNPLRPDSVFTGATYRKKRGLRADNATLMQMFRIMEQSGLSADQIWEQADEIAGRTLAAIANAEKAEESVLARHFFFIGLDMIIEKTADGFSLRLLEINATPQMLGWGISIDGELEQLYEKWAEHLLMLIRTGR